MLSKIQKTIRKLGRNKKEKKDVGEKREWDSLVLIWGGGGKRRKLKRGAWENFEQRGEPDFALIKFRQRGKSIH